LIRVAPIGFSGHAILLPKIQLRGALWAGSGRRGALLRGCPPCRPRRLSGFGLGPRRGESRCQPRRRRGSVAGPHHEPTTTDGGVNLPGPSGWACKGAHAALQMLAGCAFAVRFAPCLHPLADPTRTQAKARQPPGADDSSFMPLRRAPHLPDLQAWRASGGQTKHRANEAGRAPQRGKDGETGAARFG